MHIGNLLGASMLAAAVLAVGACADTGTGSRPEQSDGEIASVERVVDGDTIKLSDERRVRLIGVDTPETVHPSKPVECYGKEASAFVEEMLPPGTEVRLVRDVEEFDRYERTLAYVYRADDDLFINLELAEQGYAQQLTVPPNVAHAEDFGAAVERARTQGRGLWGDACADG